VGNDGARILEDAMQLAANERAELAAELIASLDGAADPDAGEAWASEVRRRARDAYSGRDQGEPWAEVREQVRDELRRR
jgi:putative addiction module component (TIGR02574 family)